MNERMNEGGKELLKFLPRLNRILSHFLEKNGVVVYFGGCKH